MAEPIIWIVIAFLDRFINIQEFHRIAFCVYIIIKCTDICITIILFFLQVSEDKEGGLIYFGDSTNGHVLSFTFQLADAYSRGFNRWFSLIILMKDKIFLLNLSPFLSEHLKVCKYTIH